MSSRSTGKTLTKQTFGLMKQNPYMLAFPVIAMLLAIVAFAVVAGIGASAVGFSEIQQQVQEETSTRHSADDSLSGSQVAILVVTLFVASYIATLISTVCMGGLVHCANEELHGRDSGLGQGFGAAFGRFAALCGWALIQTIVGWILRAISGNGANQNGFVALARVILASLLSVAWTLITFFVLPLIMLRNRGPVEAIKESAQLLKNTWGTRLRGGARIGGIILLLAILPGILMLAIGLFTSFAGMAGLGIPVLSIGVIVVIIGAVLISALRVIFSVALLHFAEEGSAIGPYDQAELAQAVQSRS